MWSRKPQHVMVNIKKRDRSPLTVRFDVAGDLVTARSEGTVVLAT